ncbi:MAG: pilus assembly protein N-terminal domain-containing protein [Woeseiaceae bacterium]
MKRLILFFCFFLLAQMSMSGAAMAKKKFILKNQYLKLYRGEVKVIRIGAIERVAVGNGKILSTSITKKGQLIILAEKSGETIVHIWGKEGWERELKIKISESNPKSAESEIKSLLRDAPGLSVRTVGGRIVIDGAVGPDDAAKIKVIKKYYPNILLLAKETAASFHDKMIHMKVQITEFSSNALEEIGINWSTSINGPYAGMLAAPNSEYINPVDGTFVAPAQDTPNINPLVDVKPFGFFGILTSMTSRINFMQTNGDALILASPTLIARSGGEAEFLAGGQIPLPSTSQNGTSIEFKDYGIKLKIKPVADDEGNITARVETELSAPDLSTAVNGIPGFLSRKAQADLSMKDGETMVISGLMNSSVSKDTSGIKYLSSIPLLGALFRNKKTIDKKTELVIFVTPTIINANSRINKEGVEQHKVLIKKFREAVDLEDWMDEDSGNADLLNDDETSEPAIKGVQQNIEPEVSSINSEATE